MVLFRMIEFGIDASIWTVRTTYNIGYWALYGHKKSTEEKLIEQQTNIIKELHHDLQLMNERLQKIEKNTIHNDINSINDKEY